jgi:hypothetical protein
VSIVYNVCSNSAETIHVNDKNVLSVFLEGLVTRVCHPESKVKLILGGSDPIKYITPGSPVPVGFPRRFNLKQQFWQYRRLQSQHW